MWVIESPINNISLPSNKLFVFKFNICSFVLSDNIDILLFLPTVENVNDIDPDLILDILITSLVSVWYVRQSICNFDVSVIFPCLHNRMCQQDC